MQYGALTLHTVCKLHMCPFSQALAVLMLAALQSSEARGKEIKEERRVPCQAESPSRSSAQSSCEAWGQEGFGVCNRLISPKMTPGALLS